MYNTKSGREISFYGIETSSNIKPISNDYKINDLKDLFEILLNVWDDKTVSPGCLPVYNNENDPSKGQCTITAMLVQDIFGGTIRRIHVGMGTHSLNEINGELYDLASDQFKVMNIPLNYEENEIADREKLNEDDNVYKRYLLLREKVLESVKDR